MGVIISSTAKESMAVDAKYFQLQKEVSRQPHYSSFHLPNSLNEILSRYSFATAKPDYHKKDMPILGSYDSFMDNLKTVLQKGYSPLENLLEKYTLLQPALAPASSYASNTSYKMIPPNLGGYQR
jgi:hypothetical protein